MPSKSGKVHPWVEAGKASRSIFDVALWIANHIPTGAPILDAGCGDGFLLSHLVRGRKFFNVYGCDIEPSHVQKSEQNIPVSCQFSDNLNIAIHEKSVVCFDFTTGNPFPEVQYAAIIALNWLHNDWRYKHATGIPRTSKPDPDLLLKVFGVVESCLLENGVLIADHGMEPEPLLQAARDVGFSVRCQLPCKKPTFVLHRKRLSES